MALALLPAIIRNALVGAPWLGINGIAAVTTALYHTAEAGPADMVTGPLYATIMAHTQGAVIPSFWEAARTHSSLWGLVRLEFLRALFAFHGFEVPNNVDFYVYRHAAPLLSWLCVPFAALVPLAGIGLATRSWRRAWPIFIALAAHVATMVLANPLSRYRVALAVALVPLAGAGLVRLAHWAQQRSWKPPFVAAVATAVYLHFALTPLPGHEPTVRAVRYAQIAEGALQQGDVDLARCYLEESVQLRPEDAAARERLDQVRALQP